MDASGLTVAVTGPTGEIGRPFVRALERVPEVGRVRAMARRRFDPAVLGWHKTEYRRGDILDRAAVDALVTDADVVVHLAFVVVKATARSYVINVEGSGNVFAAAVAAGVPTLVYTSSLAAYGYHSHEGLLTEDMPARGTERHAYSHQKAEVERVLRAALAGSATDAYVFRPCIVAGPEAPALLDQLPYLRLGQRLPAVTLDVLRRIPLVRPVLPDHGVPFQLVHHDDVADAVAAAVLGRGEPGIYNLAADGEVTMGDIAREMGWYRLPVPGLAVSGAAEVISRVPLMPSALEWVHAVRVPSIMSTERAKQQLGWQPRHDAYQTLWATVAGAGER
jgi:nucleoside-diphosphate-sugar epimerase